MRDKMDQTFDKEPFHFEINRQRLSFLVGLVAFLLPTVLISASFLELTEWRDSLSHYYYAVFFGDWFIASLAFIGTFMIVYTGREVWETNATSAVGLFTFGIALFPTSGSGIGDGTDFGRIFNDMRKVSEDLGSQSIEIASPHNVAHLCMPRSAFCLSDNAETAHYFCAIILFSFLIVYVWKVFLAIDDERHKENGVITPKKLARNNTYKFCIAVMATACLAILAKFSIGNTWSWWDYYNFTLWAETSALWAFALAWLTRSRVYGTVLVDDYQKRILEQMRTKDKRSFA